MAIVIQVNKAIEEFDILGKIYQMDMSDEAIEKYRKSWNQFEKEINELQAKPLTDETEKESKELFIKIYDLLLGKGSFEAIYNDTGKSSLVMADILKQIMDTVNVKYRAKLENNKSKYLRNKNKNKKKK